MRKIIELSIAVILLSSPAIADDADQVLSTPPMFPGTTMACVAANVGKTPVNLRIEMFDETKGTAPFSEVCQLPPGTGNFGGSLCGTLDGAPPAGWCKFTVTFGQAQNIRAAICSLDTNLGLGAAPSCLSAERN
jgi:hypothetical protein